MTDLESRAAELVADAIGKVERRRRPAFCKAVMRLSGNALAIHTLATTRRRKPTSASAASTTSVSGGGSDEGRQSARRQA